MRFISISTAIYVMVRLYEFLPAVGYGILIRVAGARCVENVLPLRHYLLARSAQIEARLAGVPGVVIQPDTSGPLLRRYNVRYT
jgi:hypothetical protein